MSNLIIIFDSKTGNTERMAEAIGKGAKSVGGANILVKKVWTMFSMEELTNADAIILGSPTHYSGVSMDMEYFLTKMEKLDLKGKYGAAFGSFGYPEEPVEVLQEKAVEALNKAMESLGMTVVEEGLRIFRRPQESDLKTCREWGKRIAQKISAGN